MNDRQKMEALLVEIFQWREMDVEERLEMYSILWYFEATLQVGSAYVETTEEHKTEL